MKVLQVELHKVESIKTIGLAEVDRDQESWSDAISGGEKYRNQDPAQPNLT